MLALSRRAIKDLRDLKLHYESLGRLDAARLLLVALEEAKVRIIAAPETGLPAPRPHPHLRREGRLWLKQGPYWISYKASDPPVITGVFYATANIPGRV